MATLLRRLQTQGPRPYRPQQPLSIHGYKEFELQISPLNSKTFSIQLPNRLPPGQGKRSCQCFVTISSAECRGKKHSLLQKRQDSILPAVFIGQIIWFFGWFKSTFPFPPDFHMWNDCFSPTEPVLELPPKWNSAWQSLRQYQRHETTTLQAAGKQQGSKASQRLCKPFGKLEKRRKSAPVSRTPIHPSNHPFRSNKLSPQWSSCRAFWYWQDKGVGWPEILLAESEERCWELCPGMWRLSGFKSRPPQALWRLAVIACTDSLMEKLFHRFRDRLIVVRRPEEQQLWLDCHHCWLIDQDGALQASQSYHWRSGTSGSHYRRGSSTSRPIKLNCDR